jgi:hypothetical protein
MKRLGPLAQRAFEDAERDIEAASHAKRAWISRFGVALAECQRAHDSPSIYAYVMRATGLRLADFKAAGLEAFDLKPLAKIAKEAWPQPARRKHSRSRLRCDICSPLRCRHAK